MTTHNVIFDLDGAVYLGDQPIAGAGETLHRLSDAGVRILFATNNSARTRTDGAAKVARVTGFPAVPEQFYNSSMAAGRLLDGPSERVLVVGGPGIVEAVEARGATVTDDWSEATAVVAGLDVDGTYAHLRDATKAIRAGARLIATNTDATFPMPDGLWPGAGATISFLTTSGGRESLVAGKPHAPMREMIADDLSPGPVWMVGDRPETDLAMAKAAGWNAVLVMTGVTEDAATVPDAYRPDVVLGSLVELPAHLGV